MRFPELSFILWLILAGLSPVGAHAQFSFADRSTLPPELANNRHYQQWLWQYEKRGFPGGEIPESPRLRGWRQIQEAKALADAAFAPVPGNAWVPIGPRPIFSGATANSGRIGDIAVNPANSNHWLVGAAQGGIWETFDAGVTWRPRTDDQPSLAFGAIAFAPGDTNIIYAGTGEEVFSGDAKSGAGLLKSADGGATWQLVAAGAFNRSSFTEIKVHPANPNIVIASTAGGIYKSTNGGTNWTQKLSGTATDLEVDPTSFTNLFCALGSVGGNSANGVYRSIDAGETWTRVDGPWSTTNSRVGRIQLAIAPSARGTLYVSIQDTGSGGGTFGVSLGIWRTDTAWDAAPAWAQLPAISTSTQLWYDHDIIVDPANPNVIYFGESSLRRYNGTAWSTITGSVHVDFHSFAWAGNRLIVGSDGGVWSTTNGGTSFNNHNTNLEITQFYHGFASPGAPNFALGGSQDNGTERWDGTNGWHSVLGGDGADCAIATSNPSNFWATSFQGLEIRRTRNGGVSFDDATAGLDLANAPFIGAFEKAWNNDDVFITGTTVLFKTTNFFSGASVTWFTNSPDIGAGIGAYAFAKSDLANTTYAFGASGGALRLTTNGGGSWVNIDAANQVPNRTIGDLAFNPTNANILYVCVAGTSGGAPANVYRTTNALAASPTWGNLSYPVDVSANTIVLDGEDPNIVYVGTDIGIWKSANGGTNWTHMGPEVGMPNVEVDELSLQNGPSRLMAFTHGRGAFLLVLANSANLALSQTASANPTSVGCDVTFTLIAVNSGIVGATGVWVTNRMPAGTSFISASTSQGSFALNGQDVVFNLGSLPITSNATMTVTVNPPGAGSLTNTATVRADQPDPDLLNNSATRVVAAFVDSGPPTLVSATASADGQTIQLAFSESVAADMATNTANYAITNGRGNTLPVTAARFGAGSSIVLLTVNVLEGLAPFVVRVSNVADCRGNTLAPGSEVIVSLPAFDLIALGAVWKYLDDGSNQGMAWRARAFNDSTWAAGPAQLGYGDGDEMTIISYGPNANAKYTTYYFRRAFVLPDASAFTNLVVSLQRDDGGIVYLNGVEIFRSNMTTGAVTSATFAATTASDDGTVFFSTNASPSLLLDGTNVVAVEIHQSNAASTDVSFDLELTGLLGPVRPPVILNEPQSTIVVAGSNATLSVLASGSSPLAYQWQHNGTNLLVASNATLTLTSVTTNQSGDYAVVVTNFAGSVTSAIATVLVAVRPVITQQPTPTNVTVVAGSSVSFTLSASGTLPMSYRWRRNGNNITNFILNANTCVFTIPIARTNDAGNYTVGVTNAAGAAPISGTAVLNVLADSDGDGMPDVFEAAFAGNFTNSHGQVVPGLSSTNAADAAIDSDGDGLTNLQEYIAGTNPHDDQSYLKVTEITSALGVITLQFPAVSNRTYSVIYRNFITNGVWSMLTNVLSRSTNRIETIYDPGPASDGRMYRLATPHAP